MYVVNYNKRELKDVELAGSHKTTVRWLIGRQNGAKTYAMRIFEIGPGGIVPLHEHPEEPLHEHPEEHEIFVLNGEAKMLGEFEGTAKKEDVVFIPSNEPHGYDNTKGTEIFRFICVIPLLNEE